MAHNIEFNKERNTYSMFSAKELPWHRLGTIVDSALTSKEAIVTANLDFEVVKKPHMIEHEGKYKINRSSFSTFRPDTGEILGTVGRDYHIIQNADAFAFFDNIVGEGEAIFETAGVLGRGEQIFITAKLPRTIVLDNIDYIEQYLLLSNSHDGSRSIEVLFTPVRVVCNNTLVAALNSSQNRVRIRHTKNASKRLEIAHRLLGINTNLIDEQEHYFNMMKDRMVTPEEFKTLLCNVFLTPAELKAVAHVGLKFIGELEDISTRKINILNEVSTYYIKGIGQDMSTTESTLWGAYNAIPGYFHNYRVFNDEEAKVKTNFYGTNYSRMQDSYKIAVDMLYDRVPIIKEEMPYKSKYN